jgi:uncharacterized membrane-anchored protein YitT (DUF2179 family)
MVNRIKSTIETARQRNWFADFVLIFIGSTLTAFATQYIFDPTGLDTGGVSGLSIIVKDLSGRLGFSIPLWVSTLVLNIPIFLLSIRIDGFRQILRTIISWIILTIELAIFPQVNFMPDNLLLVSLYGGICFGAGCGLLLQARATSGGTDTLGTVMHHFFRHYSMGRIIQILDGIIVVIGIPVFGIERTLYAVISVFVMGYVTDYILGQGKSAKMALIISKASDDIARDILTDLDRGLTGLTGTGMYTGKNRNILVCICSNKDIVAIKDIVRKYDPAAFFIITNVNEAMGEGFVERWF